MRGRNGRPRDFSLSHRETFCSMRFVKFFVSLLALSAFVFAACDTPVTRRSQYSPETPGKNQRTFSRILREQSYLKGIDRKHLRPWTVKKKDDAAVVAPGAVAVPPPAALPESAGPEPGL
jgi:hypothetical protein